MEAEAARVLERRVHAALLARAYDDAHALLADLRALDPLSVRTRGLELELLVRAGRRTEAHALAKQLAPLFAGSARVLYWAGRAAYAARDYDASAAWLDESRRVAPHPRAERWRAKALTQLARFDEAEPVLLALAAAGDTCRPDLAWLYERREEHERAIAQYEMHLVEHPRDARARENLLRLRARTTDAEALVAEVNELTALGEPLPDSLRAPYLHALLSTARSAEARALVRDLLGRVEPHVATTLGWVCYRAQAWDLAYDLLVRGLPHRATDIKHLNALQKSATLAGRGAELADAFTAHASKNAALHGRARKLRASSSGAKSGS